MRLQKEVDTFTQKLEHEKRRLMIIEEQIKQVTGSRGLLMSENKPEKSYSVRAEEKIKGISLEIFFEKQ